MATIILRRRKLGLTSCREVAGFMQEPVTVVRNDRPFPRDTDMAIRWGCTSEVPTRNVLNTGRAIHEVNSKREFRQTLQEAGLCPPTWFSVNDAGITYPCVVRPERHAQGRRLHVCNNREELVRACRRYARYYISELVDKVEEYRVCVVQGKVAWVAKKTPGNPQDVAWNVALGGRFDNVRWGEWSVRTCRIAVEAFNLTELDFGGVDVMVARDGTRTVLEINSAPSLTSPYRQECTAKCFDYIIRNGKERMTEDTERRGYGRFVHPALGG